MRKAAAPKAWASRLGIIRQGGATRRQAMSGSPLVARLATPTDFHDKPTRFSGCERRNITPAAAVAANLIAVLLAREQARELGIIQVY